MMPRPAVAFWKILLVGATIYGLLVLSLVLSFAHLGGWWSTVIALGIAIVQALFVAIFSMELFESRRSVIVIAIIAPLFLILLVSLTATDIYTRPPAPMLPPAIDKQFPRAPP